jgi:ATP adenylyltransferase
MTDPALHDNLWAPWRVGFLTGPKPSTCFLCTSPQAAPEEHRGLYLLERREHCFVIFNRYPYTNGHLLIAPYTHTGDLATLPAEVAASLMHAAQHWISRLTPVLNPAGFNVGFNLGEAAGAGVAEHLHLHIVPRWRGDTNFMSVLADTRVINQSMDALYELLTASSPDAPAAPSSLP